MGKKELEAAVNRSTSLSGIIDYAYDSHVTWRIRRSERQHGILPYNLLGVLCCLGLARGEREESTINDINYRLQYPSSSSASFSSSYATSSHQRRHLGPAAAAENVSTTSLLYQERGDKIMTPQGLRGGRKRSQIEKPVGAGHRAWGVAEATGTCTVRTDCGLVRSGNFIHVQDHLATQAEKDTTGKNSSTGSSSTNTTTTVVPFLGLRYAAPMTTAEQRWKPPEPSRCWEEGTVHDASAYGDVCVQADGHYGVEDCLFLNIFTPLQALVAREAVNNATSNTNDNVHRGGGVTVNSSGTSSIGKKEEQLEGGEVGATTTGRKKEMIEEGDKEEEKEEENHGGGRRGLSPSSSSRRREQIRDKEEHPSLPPSPSTNSTSGLLPVFFFIHGGGLMMGESHHSLAGVVGDSQHPVVVVSIDHRLNIFGFLVIKELSEEQKGSSGNYGVRDQIQALHWVKQNIAFFGGDPNRITVIGQSSGGTSVFALMSSPLAKGLFHRAISLSGSPNITLSLQDAKNQNRGVMESSPCGSLPDSHDRLSCLRNLSIPDLLDLMPTNWSTPGMWDLPQGPEGQHYGGLPVIDGEVLPTSFLEALYPEGEKDKEVPTSSINDVPFLLGNMGYEADCCASRDVSGSTFDQWVDYITQAFAPWGPDVGSHIAALYYTDATQDPQKAYSSIQADYAVICGAAEAARRAARNPHFHSPVYLYVNNWGPSSPINRGAQAPAMRYAFHGWDETNWLRSYPQGYTPSDLDLQHSRLLRRLFYEFAAKGHLKDSKDGWTPVNQTPGWPNTYGVYVIQPPTSLPAEEGVGGGKPTTTEAISIKKGGGKRTPTDAPAAASTSNKEGGGEGGPAMVINYKADVCDLYRSIGLWQNAWWVN